MMEFGGSGSDIPVAIWREISIKVPSKLYIHEFSFFPRFVVLCLARTG